MRYARLGDIYPNAFNFKFIIYLYRTSYNYRNQICLPTSVTERINMEDLEVEEMVSITDMHIYSYT